MDKSIRFWNWIANWYAKQAISDPKAYEEKLERTRAHLKPDSRVLEVGCGTGSTALIHAPLVQHILAIDSSPKMIQIANGKLRIEDPGNVEFKEGTVFDISGETPYDTILALNVLHLVPDLKATLSQCAKLLKPGGILIASTPCIDESSKALKFILPIPAALGLVPKVSCFDVATLVKTCRDAGFEVVDESRPGKDKSVSFLICRRS